MKPFKLEKEILEKWITALESGKYKQGEKVLCGNINADDNNYKKSYCCMGVLGCELGIDENTLLNVGFLSDIYVYNDKVPYAYSNIIPNIFLENPLYSFNLPIMLSNLNDGCSIYSLKRIKHFLPSINFNIQSLEELKDTYVIKFDFIQIADFLKKNVEPVIEQRKKLTAKEQDAFDKGYTKGWTEGFNSGKLDKNN